VKRATLYADAKFAATLDHLVELMGDRVPKAFWPNPPLTKNDVLRLASWPPMSKKASSKKC